MRECFLCGPILWLHKDPDAGIEITLLSTRKGRPLIRYLAVSALFLVSVDVEHLGGNGGGDVGPLAHRLQAHGSPCLPLVPRKIRCGACIFEDFKRRSCRASVYISESRQELGGAADDIVASRDHSVARNKMQMQGILRTVTN